MRAHAALGNPAEAAFVYQRLRARLLAELDVEPAPETAAVLRKLTGSGQASARKGSGT